MRRSKPRLVRYSRTDSRSTRFSLPHPARVQPSESSKKRGCTEARRGTPIAIALPGLPLRLRLRLPRFDFPVETAHGSTASAPRPRTRGALRIASGGEMRLRAPSLTQRHDVFLDKCRRARWRCMEPPSLCERPVETNSVTDRPCGTRTSVQSEIPYCAYWTVLRRVHPCRTTHTSRLSTTVALPPGEAAHTPTFGRNLTIRSVFALGERCPFAWRRTGLQQSLYCSWDKFTSTHKMAGRHPPVRLPNQPPNLPEYTSGEDEIIELDSSGDPAEVVGSIETVGLGAASPTPPTSERYL
ncbi:hypothetical protein BKA93DRAFT_151346 [Sparassis latifolia]